LICPEEASKNASVSADAFISLEKWKEDENSHKYSCAVGGECNTIRMHKLVSDYSDLSSGRIKAVNL
jgi:hypothetical protein